jgi:ABC-type Fe3+ transport system permease subunit
MYSTFVDNVVVRHGLRWGVWVPAQGEQAEPNPLTSLAMSFSVHLVGSVLCLLLGMCFQPELLIKFAASLD